MVTGLNEIQVDSDTGATRAAQKDSPRRPEPRGEANAEDAQLPAPSLLELNTRAADML